MDRHQLRKRITTFLYESNVNLGRKGSKTKQQFIHDLMVLIDEEMDQIEGETTKQPKQKHRRKSTMPSNKDIMVIKPRKQNSKGVNMMTQSDSIELDEKR